MTNISKIFKFKKKQRQVTECQSYFIEEFLKKNVKSYRNFFRYVTQEKNKPK